MKTEVVLHFTRMIQCLLSTKTTIRLMFGSIMAAKDEKEQISIRGDRQVVDAGGP